MVGSAARLGSAASLLEGRVAVDTEGRPESAAWLVKGRVMVDAEGRPESAAWLVVDDTVVLLSRAYLGRLNLIGLAGRFFFCLGSPFPIWAPGWPNCGG